VAALKKKGAAPRADKAASATGADRPTSVKAVKREENYSITATKRKKGKTVKPKASKIPDLPAAAPQRDASSYYIFRGRRRRRVRGVPIMLLDATGGGLVLQLRKGERRRKENAPISNLSIASFRRQRKKFPSPACAG